MVETPGPASSSLHERPLGVLTRPFAEGRAATADSLRKETQAAAPPVEMRSAAADFPTRLPDSPRSSLVQELLESAEPDHDREHKRRDYDVEGRDRS